jgi:hypothetical protein
MPGSGQLAARLVLLIAYDCNSQLYMALRVGRANPRASFFDGRGPGHISHVHNLRPHGTTSSFHPHLPPDHLRHPVLVPDVLATLRNCEVPNLLVCQLCTALAHCLRKTPALVFPPADDWKSALAGYPVVLLVRLQLCTALCLFAMLIAVLVEFRTGACPLVFAASRKPQAIL